MAREKDLDYSVYMHINKINGKIYIGITSQEPTRRWNNGKSYTGKYFSRQIKKYGWDNFDHIIICDGLSFDQACSLEIELIAQYDTTNPHNGYNVSTCGEMSAKGAHWKLSSKTRKKMSDAAKGDKNGFYGKHFTAEQRKKISNAIKGEKNGFYGKHHSDATKNKIRKSLKEHRKKHGTGGNKVYRIETKILYNNQRECAKFLNVSPSLICAILKGRRAQIPGHTLERR